MKTTTYIVTEEQRRLDLAMVPYDIWGTRAHVRMLHAIDVLDKKELARILDALATIERRVEEGGYEIDPSLGAQLTLEQEITTLAGREAGGKVHTGRSRNDQVITAQRLYLRDRLLEVENVLLEVTERLVIMAAAHVRTVMPGYTHMQPAKPTTFGQWCLAYADMLLRDVERMEESFARWNRNPLGAAESYGSSWLLDRALTAEILGFDGVQEIPMDVVATRGEMEAELLSNLSFVTLHLSKLAQDLLMFTTFEFRLVHLGQRVARRMGKVTGSSIMPQKKNPDVLELLRADASVVYSLLFQTLEVLKALPFGYNRDSRESKATVTAGLARVMADLATLGQTLDTLSVDEARMKQAVIDNYSLATDLADYLAQEYGLPYRAAYTAVGKVVDGAIHKGKALHEVKVGALAAAVEAETGTEINLTQAELERVLDPVRCLNRRQHIGGAAPARMEEALANRRERLRKHHTWVETQQERIAQARYGCCPEAQM